MTRRSYGNGSIERRAAAGTYRLRYRINGNAYQKTVHGSLTDARKQLRALLLVAGDTGEHVAPDKITLAAWIDQWIANGAPGRRKKRVNQNTLEGYELRLRRHVIPMLGSRPLQELRSHEIDTLYSHLEGKLAPRTAHHVHMILGACLGTAHRKGLIAANPMVRVERVPSPSEADHGMTLDADQLRAVVDGFRSSTLFSVVAIAALAGLRRNEILGLQWSDLDVANKTLRIERAVEDTKGFGLRLKEPKSARHKRTIVIDDELIALLCTERDRHLRILAGVPDGMAVDLSLVKLPVGSLMFPKPPGRGRDFVPTALRRPRNVTKELARKAKVLGFSGL